MPLRMSDALSRYQGKPVVVHTIYRSVYRGVMLSAGDYVVTLAIGPSRTITIRRDAIEAAGDDMTENREG